VFNEPVTELDPVFTGHYPHEIAFGPDGVGGPRQAEPPRNPAHMGVHNHPRRDPEGRPKHDVGGFSPHAGEADEFFDRAGNLATVAVHERPGRLFALARKKPVLRITASRSRCFAPARVAASGQRRNSSGVTMLTRLSVHWAERIVAITS
jgi:hypothetical protein